MVCFELSYINFITSYNEFRDIVHKCKNNDEKILQQTNNFKQFIDKQHTTYLEKLEYVINN